MEEALIRLKLAADAGADVCFIEGVKSKELLVETVSALAPKPVLVNVISGGLTPGFTYSEAEQMGAKIISEYSFSETPMPQVINSHPALQSFLLSRVWPWFTLCGPRCSH